MIDFYERKNRKFLQIHIKLVEKYSPPIECEILFTMSGRTIGAAIGLSAQRRRVVRSVQGEMLDSLGLETLEFGLLVRLGQPLLWSHHRAPCNESVGEQIRLEQVFLEGRNVEILGKQF